MGVGSLAHPFFPHTRKNGTPPPHSCRVRYCVEAELSVLFQREEHFVETKTSAKTNLNFFAEASHVHDEDEAPCHRGYSRDHGAGAFALDAALREFHKCCLDLQAPLVTQSGIVDAVKTLYNYAYRCLPSNVLADARARIYTDALACADDIVFYCSHHAGILAEFHDERKCGDEYVAPTTPRSIPPYEHLVKSMQKLRHLQRMVVKPPIKSQGSPSWTQKIRSALDCIRDYATRLSDSSFIKRLVLDDGEFSGYRRNLSSTFSVLCCNWTLLD